MDQPRRPRVETYIACLECGRRFPYDWATMRVTCRQAIRFRGDQVPPPRERASRFVAMNGFFHRLLVSLSSVKA